MAGGWQVLRLVYLVLMGRLQCYSRSLELVARPSTVNNMIWLRDRARVESRPSRLGTTGVARPQVSLSSLRHDQTLNSSSSYNPTQQCKIFPAQTFYLVPHPRVWLDEKKFTSVFLASFKVLFICTFPEPSSSITMYQFLDHQGQASEIEKHRKSFYESCK